MFSVSPSKAERKPTQSNKTQQVSLLDIKRANNVAILLSHFKLSFEDIKQALLQFDDDILPAEKLLALKSIIPTEEERKILYGYKGDVASLGQVEQFLLNLLKIPKLELRIEFFLMVQHFPQMVLELSEVNFD
jgi:hypothetical protein